LQKEPDGLRPLTEALIEIVNQTKESDSPEASQRASAAITLLNYCDVNF